MVQRKEGLFTGSMVAAPGLGVAVEDARGASDSPAPCVVGLGADVAAPVGPGTVATAAPGAGVCSPQASRAAKINRTIHRGNFIIRETTSIVISEFRVPYG